MKINIINVNFQTKKGKEKEILGNKKNGFVRNRFS